MVPVSACPSVPMSASWQVCAEVRCSSEGVSGARKAQRAHCAESAACKTKHRTVQNANDARRGLDFGRHVLPVAVVQYPCCGFFSHEPGRLGLQRDHSATRPRSTRMAPCAWMWKTQGPSLTWILQRIDGMDNGDRKQCRGVRQKHSN